jgi:hypothetical protein
MSWVMGAVALAFAGMVVVGYCAVRVFGALRNLSGELDRARARLEPERAALQGELSRFAPARE